MADKPQVTKSFHPLHFEDLDPHRFEDLVRQLIYDFRDWHDIEATGRVGSDEGVDIRAWEKAPPESTHEVEDDGEDEPVIEGNMWFVQCKREKELGPTAVRGIVRTMAKGSPLPYGYILAAPVNFSKKSYDAFRDELRQVGVKEFYIWGRAELEDMLAMPKNDHVLFAFFGISYTTKKRTRITEIRFRVNTKNKLQRILGDDLDGRELNHAVLLRDLNDVHYPNDRVYPDFDKRPRWEEYRALALQPDGLVLFCREHFASYDKQAKHFDYTDAFNLVQKEPRTHCWKDDREQFDLQNNVRSCWKHLPRQHQAIFKLIGLIPFEDIAFVDEKGDSANPFLHIYVDFKYGGSPLARTRQFLEWQHESIDIQADLKRVEVFPKEFAPFVVGTVYEDKQLTLSLEELSQFKRNPDYFTTLFDVEKKYSYLKQRDAIFVTTAETTTDRMYLEVTHEYRTTVGKYLSGIPGALPKDYIERQVGHVVKEPDRLHVFEVQAVYGWQISRWQAGEQ